MLTKAPPDVVFKLSTDWSGYPQLFSRVKECAVVEKSGSEEIVRFKVDAIFFTLSYFARHVIDFSRRSVFWELDPRRRNDLEFNSGSLNVMENRELNGTLVTYSLSSDLSKPFFLPAFLKRYYMRKEVARALRELRKASEKRF